MTDQVSARLSCRMGEQDAHYGGGLVSGARLIEMLHDVATELCVRHDGDEGLFAGYSDIRFLAPVRAGDFLEARGVITRVGNTSREMSFEIFRYIRPRPDLSDSAAEVVATPELVLTATGTCVVGRATSGPSS